MTSGSICARQAINWGQAIAALTNYFGQVSAASIGRLALWILFSCTIAELVGYFLHRFLHSETIPWLSRSHMLHHLKHYGPHSPMRPGPEYVDATDGRLAIGNVGLEWLVPSGLLISVFVAIFTIFRATLFHQILFVVIAVSWASFMFSYLHDRMHMRDFWMEKTPGVRKWFLSARRMHDIHHYGLADNGRMDSNFGIGFYFLDRVFRTRRNKLQEINRVGWESVRQRYDFLREQQAGQQDSTGTGPMSSQTF